MEVLARPMVRRVIITGGSGLLGKYLTRIIENRHEDIFVLPTYFQNKSIGHHQYMEQLDVRDSDEVERMIRLIQPDVVFHCAAIGSVDIAEEEPDVVREVNVGGTENIVRSCSRHHARLVYVSSNAVYGGDSAPYDDYDAQFPINVYGTLKSDAESAVRNNLDNYLIVRPIMLYGVPYKGSRGNWAMMVVEKLFHKVKVQVVTDTMTQPTYAGDCADIMWRLRCNIGEYNIGSNDSMNLYSFARMVAQIFELDSRLIEPVLSDCFPNMAPRPVDTTYTLNGLTAVGIEAQRVHHGLRQFMCDMALEELYLDQGVK